MKTRLHYFFGPFCFLMCTVFAQANDNNAITTLSNVTKIIQDKQGFVWLAGQHGLTRIDGSNNITFSLDNQTWPLPFSWIHNANIANDKLLLATESDGTWLFDSKTGESEKIPANIARESHYRAIQFKDNYYLYAPKKLFRYNPKNNTTKLIQDNLTIKIISHNNKQLYIANDLGLYQLEGERLVKVIDEPVNALTTLSSTTIAITPTNIYRINQNGTITSIPHNDKIYGLCKEHNTNNFFTLNNKGHIVKYDASNLSTLPHLYGNIQKVHASQMFHDSSEVLWVISSQGVQQLSENYIVNHKKFFDITINANEIALFDDEIIIGSYGVGLQNFTAPVFNQNVNDNFTKKGLKILQVLTVNHELYIGSFDGLWRYNKKSGQVTKEDFLGDEIILKLIHKNDLLYIATNDNGLYIYNLKTKEIIKHLNIDNGLSNPEVIDVLPVSSNKVWLANRSKITIYDTITDSVTTLITPNKSKVADLIIADNKIFASTIDDGILVFNQQGHLLFHLSKGQKFNSMLEVNGEIWVSGRPGLYRFSPKNYQITMVENTQKYTFVGSMLVKDNKLYAIHYAGVLALELTKRSVFNPPVVISKTTISGRSYLLNKTIEIDSANDVITLNLASLDYRPGLTKKFQYRINNSAWQRISNNQLTLTGLTSGEYNIEIMATNSLGQWSENKAYTEINVAYPWYWAVELRIIYATVTIFIILLTLWLLFLRTKSIKHIHNLLKDDVRNYDKLMKTVQRNLQLISTALANNELVQSQHLVKKSILVLEDNFNTQEPDNLSGKQLSIAIPFLADYINAKYLVKLNSTLDDKIDSLHYELKADVYKVVYEALMSGIFKSKADNFNLTLQEVKHKLWLTIDSDNDSFSQLNSKVNFDIESYTVRQITHKHHASLNTFTNDDGSSQLVISFPLMQLN